MPNEVTFVLALPGNEAAAAALAEALGVDWAAVAIRQFPDEESLVTLPAIPAGSKVVLVCTLDRPDAKLAPLLFAADAARELGATRVGLVAPYLAYMRQDARFAPGQAISSTSFARVLARHIDFLVTVDPHLHRHHSLEALFGIPATVVPSAPAVALWIGQHVSRPLLIGPDEESEQWTSALARLIDAPYLVLRKIRRGDADVSVSAIDGAAWQGTTPVLVDDILSTARTMIAAVGQLRAAGLPAPICIGVHPILAGDALAALTAAGAVQVASCNTIAHPTNCIDLVPDIARALPDLLFSR